MSIASVKVSSPAAVEVVELLRKCHALFQRPENLTRLLQHAAELLVEGMHAECSVIAWIAEDENTLYTRSSYSRNGRNRLLEGPAPILEYRDISRFSEWRDDQAFLHLASASPDEKIVVAKLRAQGTVVGYCYLMYEPGAGGNFAGRHELFSALIDQIDAAIEHYQIRRFLDSRYATMALSRTAAPDQSSSQTLDTYTLAAVKNPEKVAKMLARSFYKDLRRAGFEPKQVLVVASELIENLNLALRRTREKSNEAD